MARKYEPIWTTLKQKGSCKIVAPAFNHKKIIKMVIKEKYKDIQYKLENQIDGNNKKVLAYIVEGNTISFTLKTKSLDHANL